MEVVAVAVRQYDRSCVFLSGTDPLIRLRRRSALRRRGPILRRRWRPFRRWWWLRAAAAGRWRRWWLVIRLRESPRPTFAHDNVNERNRHHKAIRRNDRRQQRGYDVRKSLAASTIHTGPALQEHLNSTSCSGPCLDTFSFQTLRLSVNRSNLSRRRKAWGKRYFFESIFHFFQYQKRLRNFFQARRHYPLHEIQDFIPPL